MTTRRVTATTLQPGKVRTISLFAAFPSNPLVLWTAACPAGADPQAAYRATGIQRVAPIDSSTASTAFISVKSKVTVAADAHLSVTNLGNDVERGTNQAD